MARAIALKRAKATRPRTSSLGSADVASTAVAHRRPSRESTSSSESSSPSSGDAPFRNLRKRTSNQRWQADDPNDRKPMAVETGQDATRATQNRKRLSTTSIESTNKPGDKYSKKEASLSVAVTTTNDACAIARDPLTRSQRKLNQVTPSPAQDSTATAFSFHSTPPAKRPKTNVFDLSPQYPPDVVPLYPKAGQGQKFLRSSTCCTCDEDACSSKSLAATFVQVYGEEFYSIMKLKETSIIIPATPSPSPSSSQGSRASSGRSQDSSTSNMLLMSPNLENRDEEDDDDVEDTPAFRRGWVYLDTGKIDPIKTVESSKFLDYQPELNPKMRAILMDWIIELSEHFNFGPTTLHLAISLVDHVLACGPLSFDDELLEDESRFDREDESKTNCFLIPRDRFQLLGATCTWIACKLEEQNPPKVAQIAYVSDNIYSVDQIKRMERRVCNALGFALIRQTPYPFIHEFMRASSRCTNPGCECTPVFRNMVHYLLELGRLPYLPVTKNPSLLAAAAVYLSRATLGIGGGRWTPTLEYFTGYSKEDLKDVVLCLHGYQRAAEDSDLKSVFDKYRSKKYRRVALKTVPLVEDLGF